MTRLSHPPPNPSYPSCYCAPYRTHQAQPPPGDGGLGPGASCALVRGDGREHAPSRGHGAPSGARGRARRRRVVFVARARHGAPPSPPPRLSGRRSPTPAAAPEPRTPTPVRAPQPCSLGAGAAVPASHPLPAPIRAPPRGHAARARAHARPAPRPPGTRAPARAPECSRAGAARSETAGGIGARGGPASELTTCPPRCQVEVRETAQTALSVLVRIQARPAPAARAARIPPALCRTLRRRARA